MENVALVLAGGKGERTWPKSTAEYPKQFQVLSSNRSLLQRTVDRLRLLLPPEQIYVVTNEKYKEISRYQLPYLDERNIIIEPWAKNTAAAVGYAALVIKEELNYEPVMVVIPSDHLIINDQMWVDTLKGAFKLAKKAEIVVVGVEPSRAEEEYGYIILGRSIPGRNKTAFYAQKFIEKPDIELAKSLVRAGNCLWNSGVFVWQASSFWKLLNKHLPELAGLLNKIKNEGLLRKPVQKFNSDMKKLCEALPSLSIDIGIAEKCKNIAVAKGSFYWDDLGNWKALDRNNLCRNEHVLTLDSDGCIVDWENSPAVIIGVKELVVSGTDKGLLVCPKNRLSEIKTVLKSPVFTGIQKKVEQKREAAETGAGAVINKPWGREIIFAHTREYIGKILVIVSGEATSLHYHKEKEETFYIDSGTGFIQLGSKKYFAEGGKVFQIPPGVPHRIVAVENVRVIEVSNGHLDDVIYIEDKYGRKKKKEGW